eukprot:RCo011287
MSGRLSMWFGRLRGGFRAASKARIAGFVLAGATTGGFAITFGSLFFPESAVYDTVVMPMLRSLSPETARAMIMLSLRVGLHPRDRSGDAKRMEECLGLSVWEIPFSSPLGISAGIDRDGTVFRQLLRMGFGHVEVGSVTPDPSPGGRASSAGVGPAAETLVEDEAAVVSAYGLPSAGAEQVGKNMLKMKKLD